jgi:hypothetical protein
VVTLRIVSNYDELADFFGYDEKYDPPAPPAQQKNPRAGAPGGGLGRHLWRRDPLIIGASSSTADL